MQASIFLCIVRFAGFATFCVLPTIVAAQLTPLNFVYTGIGGQSDLIRFTHAQGIFKKYGLDATMIYVVSGVTTPKRSRREALPWQTATRPTDCELSPPEPR